MSSTTREEVLRHLTAVAELQPPVQKTGKAQGAPPKLDLDKERALQGLALELARAHVVRSMHDASDGGLAAALVECAVGADRPELVFGCDVALDADASDAASELFAEDPSRVVASCERFVQPLTCRAT